MTFEEIKAAVAGMSHADKQRFMEEVGMGICKEMMADPAFIERMFPRCMEMMKQMPSDVIQRMQEMMSGAGTRR